MTDIIRCKRRTAVDAVIAMLAETSQDHILVVGDPSLADELRRWLTHKTVRCANQPLPGWTVVMADYGPPSLWERLSGRTA